MDTYLIELHASTGCHRKMRTVGCHYSHSLKHVWSGKSAFQVNLYFSENVFSFANASAQLLVWDDKSLLKKWRHWSTDVKGFCNLEMLASRTTNTGARIIENYAQPKIEKLSTQTNFCEFKGYNRRGWGYPLLVHNFIKNELVGENSNWCIDLFCSFHLWTCNMNANYNFNWSTCRACEAIWIHSIVILFTCVCVCSTCIAVLRRGEGRMSECNALECSVLAVGGTNICRCEMWC